ncbi:hypothetical protein LUZ63_001868 [Rhynchospora breviuscula]|uniref:KIB1-4 beta-propeller domain-containing protein n=1 Tax=Rhynchospora breviuscula TaxID=2022672 RepID=A0A9Q0HXB6_9POAL|nr:hypothetical protein LUZ63_001868 [Rhynchospora breviuscula]
MKTESNEAQEKDWVALPPDVLNLIAKLFNEITHFVRFRAVCPSWRSSTPVTDLAPQFPWILDNRKDPHDPNLSFYSVTFNKIYTINAPSSLNKTLSGHSDGYMFTFSQRHQAVSLLNPLNNHHIPLPAYQLVGNPQWIGPRETQMGEYVVCYGHSGHQSPKLVFCHPSQNYWRELELSSDYTDCHHFYLKGMLFSVERITGATKVTNIADGTLAYVIPPVEGHLAQVAEYLVEDSRGDILRVPRHNPRFINGLDVYRLDVATKNGLPRWVKVNNIGNQALFIDKDGGFVLRASHLSGIKENCIYFLKKIYMGVHIEPSYGVERIDIETSAREHIPCPLKEPVSWLVPSLCHLSAQ